MIRNVMWAGVAAALTVLSGCGSKITIEDEPTVKFGSYWVDSFYGEPEQEMSVEFRVAQGNAVDILLLPGYGYQQYASLLVMDTLLKHTGGPVRVDSFSAHRFGTSTGTLAVKFSSDVAADVFIMDETNYNRYIAHQAFEAIMDTAVTASDFVFVTEQPILYAVIDNTNSGSRPRGPVTYSLILGSYKNSGFTYYVYGSCLGTYSYRAEFKLIDKGWYYYVVNNAIPLGTGEVPSGDVKMYIKIQEN